MTDLRGLDAYLTHVPDDGDALNPPSGVRMSMAEAHAALARLSAPRYCDCGAVLTDDDGTRCLLCDERIDLGRLDGPDYEDEL